ncbi:MAG: tRNA (adenosine(37)-N6)-threonylcarbamoyltransferase complex ATPase subunit type 1 TsaE [Clostridiales bacterium]|nr:tRNA (adenosine(37)-N6)-threonylcarbamoyltransferase complex ATPase subunit type 1 TsaE [Clostridiales bacterium]
MFDYISKSEQDTEQLGFRLAGNLKAGDVLAFFGDLGAGKTAFTRGLARGLGITDAVSSPTFSIVHEYDGRIPLFHFDMYRVNSWDGLYSTGFFDYLERGGIIAIEWSENIENVLPEGYIRIEITRTDSGDDNERRITIIGDDRIYEDLGDRFIGGISQRRDT